ncbi:nucleoside recognition domain-containing protein [Paenibacillus lemnae]|uniref:Nucleoside recognition protein n=1 Tax=Paenibacillus lemnae TaxID=1330551 RepID=A0A848M8T6_PAELE|nr:nucleoside recognition domain-containing protein [Paenibacillus lemnae]NMO96492.1 nucleoside recognition protein [Paenibacillus lemnae]
MNKGKSASRTSGMWMTITLGAAAFLLVIAVVGGSEPVFQASIQALKLWWNIVFPALLPFLVLAEILIAFGWAQGLGVLLDPFMRRVFHLPGSAGWVLVTGMTAGFPAGAQAAASALQQGSLMPQDTHRLVSLSHFCNPMTILVVIGSGLLHQPDAGYLLLCTHWISGLLAAWLFTLKDRYVHSGSSYPVSGQQTAQGSVLIRAVHAAEEARNRDGRSFGRLLGDSVTRSVQTLMVTGGYIIIFAVMVQIVTMYLPFISTLAASGLLELYAGARNWSETPFIHSGALQLAALSALLAWSGISAQLQTLSTIKAVSSTWGPFIMSRLLHAVLAFGLTLILWKPVLAPVSILPAFGEVPGHQSGHDPSFDLWHGLLMLLQWQIMIFAGLILLFITMSRMFIKRTP